MHLTPEQIDRQPFRMTRRGYDIVQVRDFLREVATEMRERQHVRDRLAEADDGEAAAEEKANAIISSAQGTAAGIMAEAEERAGSAEALERGRQRAAEIVAEAEAEAEALADGAEERARQRSGVVIAEAQSRLDGLLAEEKQVRERIESQRVAAAPIASASALGFDSSSRQSDPLADSRDRGETAKPDTSLADFMKSTLRQEVARD